jgi:hypothetical protein
VVVVDLAVEHHHDVAVSTRHGLCGRGGQVEHGQPGMAEDHTGCGEDTAIVRPAMADGLQSGLYVDGLPRLHEHSTKNSTHGGLTLSH